ncbi:unnamed protein product [Discosporangium mesarthrocarpum]
MSGISTEKLNFLPKSSELRQICKSISTLEAILCQDWEYRYYSYQKDWGENEEVCEMRNGEGDQMLILFAKEGTCINGFAHESRMNGWKKVEVQEKKSFAEKLFGTKKEVKTKLIQEIPFGILEGLPKVFNEFIFGEPVKSIGTTFCIWQIRHDEEWKVGEIKLPDDDYKDGSKDLLKLLDGNTLTYKNWAEEYYEIELKQELIEDVFNGKEITDELIKGLNPELEDKEKLRSDLEEIGYGLK